MASGKPLFINKFNESITLNWIFDKFFNLARKSGIQKKIEGTNNYLVDSHELRDLLKSTLIDCGCRIGVAEEVMGHKQRDSYEKQTKLYPETFRKEYAKASKRLNIFTKFSNVVSGKDDTDELRLELRDKISEMDKLKGDLVMEMAIKKRDEIFAKRQYEMMQDMQKQIDGLSRKVSKEKTPERLE